MFAHTEHSHSHAHGTGIKWLDLIVAVSAVFISVVSLVVSIEHGKTMEHMAKENEKMVAANTMPYLTISTNEIDPDTHKQVLRLVLKNGGVGPAVVDWFELKYKGKPYNSVRELLEACCAAEMPRNGQRPQGVIYSNVSKTIIPPREVVNFIDLRTEAGDGLIRALRASGPDMSVNACYCSVLDECWQTDFGPGRPTKVEACRVPEGAVTW